MNTYVCYLLHIFFKQKFNLSLDYKWPNDLYLNNRKFIGILTQNEITGTSCTYKIGLDLLVPLILVLVIRTKLKPRASPPFITSLAH